MDKEELTCIDCIYCILDDNTIKDTYFCDYSGCIIDDPEQDYCDTEFVLNY